MDELDMASFVQIQFFDSTSPWHRCMIDFLDIPAMMEDIGNRIHTLIYSSFLYVNGYLGKPIFRYEIHVGFSCGIPKTLDLVGMSSEQ